MASRLARHEAAQRLSRAQEEASGARTLSFSTKEVVDYLSIRPEGCTAVEIKTGGSRLKPSQKAWCNDPPIPTRVEWWSFWGGAWQLRKRSFYAPKAAQGVGSNVSSHQVEGEREDGLRPNEVLRADESLPAQRKGLA